METKTKKDYTLSSVKNALRLLLSFSLEEPEKKVTELAHSSGIGKSNVSRLLITLASEGFVIKDPETQKYRLGLSILNLNTIISSNLKINRESQPVLQGLVNDIGETSHIAVMENKEVVYLHNVQCKHPVQILTHIGRRNQLHCTSSGKVLLAFQKEEVIERYIEEGLKKFAKNTITNPGELRTALKTIKTCGYGNSVEELSEGVASIAAPIMDYTGKIAYAITVTGPVHRMDPHNEYLIKKVKRAAKEISENLGYKDR